MNVKNVIWASIVTTAISCQSVKKDALSFENYPVREGELTEMEYSPAKLNSLYGLPWPKK